MFHTHWHIRQRCKTETSSKAQVASVLESRGNCEILSFLIRESSIGSLAHSSRNDDAPRDLSIRARIPGASSFYLF